MTPIEPRKDSAIVVGGARVDCALPVILWGESGLLFNAATQRRKRTTCVVVHWTGSENAPADIHRNMTLARTSVHFIVTPDGLVWQTADTDRKCAHVRGMNDTTIGIEVVCRGDDPLVPHKGVVRSEVDDFVHGRRVRYARFTSAQSMAVLVLVTLLCGVYHLPVQLPLDRRGELITSVLSTLEAKSFRGVAGHYHFFSGKNDPGPQNLRIFLPRDGEPVA